jgi:hypothetical protein
MLFLGRKSVQNLRGQIYPKSLRPKRSFVKSVPEHVVLVSEPHRRAAQKHAFKRRPNPTIVSYSARGQFFKGS